MLKFIKHIIYRMLDFCRRRWKAFFAGFLTSLGLCIQVIIVLSDKWYMNALAISLGVLALICLIVALIGVYYDCQDFRREAKKIKADKMHKELVESFKRMNPEWTDEQAEIAARGR